MSEQTAPIARADEGLTGSHADGRAYIRFERRLQHPVERVWAAITDPREMEKWLARKVELEPLVGGRFALHLGGPSEPAPVPGRVTVFDPPRVFEAEDGGEEGVLRWEITPADGGCVLTFTHTLVPGDRARNAVIAGWHIRMEQLPRALDGDGTDWVALEATRNERGVIARIEEIYWHYRNQPR